MTTFRPLMGARLLALKPVAARAETRLLVDLAEAVTVEFVGLSTGIGDLVAGKRAVSGASTWALPSGECAPRAAGPTCGAV